MARRGSKTKRRPGRKPSPPLVRRVAAILAVLALGAAGWLAMDDALDEPPPPRPQVAQPAAPAAQAPAASRSIPQPPPPQMAALPRPPEPAVPPQAQAHGPRIAIVIDDMGLDRARSLQAIGLPAPITLSFLSYAENLQSQVAAARAKGHEIFLHLPMEPEERSIDAGPEALAAGEGEAETARRLRWHLDRFTGYVGVNNHMGSRASADPAVMEAVLDEMDRRGLVYLDSRTTPRTAAPAVAAQRRMAVLSRDVFLDNERTVPAVEAQLAETERIAREHGQALAIGHPAGVTLEALARWLPGAKSRGFEIVPATALLAKPPPG